MDQTLRSYATMGVAVVGAGMIAVTPLATPDIHLAAPHSIVDVALTSGVAPAFDIGDLLPGGLDLGSIMDLSSIIGMITPYLSQITDGIVDAFDALHSNAVSIDSMLAAAGVTGVLNWITSEGDLVHQALVADGFDPLAYDPSTLFSPELGFGLNLDWASSLLGLTGDHSAELNELLGLGSQLLTGTLNALVVTLGTLNPLLADLGPDTDLSGLMTALQPLFDGYLSQAQDIVGDMMPILDDLGLGDFVS